MTAPDPKPGLTLLHYRAEDTREYLYSVKDVPPVRTELSGVLFDPYRLLVRIHSENGSPWKLSFARVTGPQRKPDGTPNKPVTNIDYYPFRIENVEYYPLDVNRRAPSWVADRVRQVLDAAKKE